jgi:hypothetical protein
MIRRVLALAAYHWGDSFRSLGGVLLLILSAIFAYLFFINGGRAPDVDYYTLVIGSFGAAATFVTTITIAGRAYRAENAAWMARLPSRIEYLAAIWLAGLCAGLTLQLLVALIALLGRPELTLVRVLELPPLWIAANIFAGVLSLHATDMVTRDWSRVYVFSVLLVFLFGTTGGDVFSRWLSGRARSLSSFFAGQGVLPISNGLGDVANWLVGDGLTTIGDTLGLAFWPFRAILDAAIAGSFTRAQALAPAFLLIYATILFMLAADFFAGKDIILGD